MDQLETPVALFVFNRPDTTKCVLDRIRQARPQRLFVIADGPRPHKEDETRQCQAARDLIDTIDWPCDVATNFSAVNLGCGRRMSSGISWVFDQTAEAIFLEDDCVPSVGFFTFCSELLERYRNDTRVGMISGDCFLPQNMECSDSYYFSRYPHIWGWAGWRRAWTYYDFELTRYPLDINSFVQDFGSPAVGQYFYDRCSDIQQGHTDTWDYQVTYSFVKNSLLTIIPSRNLVSNIGFGTNATHTRDAESPHARLTAYELDQPLQHPACVTAWEEADRYTEREVYGIRPDSISANVDEDADVDESEPGIVIWHPSVYLALKEQMMGSIAKPFSRTTHRFTSNRPAPRGKRTTAVIIDPALAMEGGHNYSAHLRIETELAKLDIEHTSFASITADAAVRASAAPILPSKGLWWRGRYTRSEFARHVGVMRNHLSVALNEQRRPPDLLILPCCDAVQVSALAAYYGQISRIPTPHLLIWLLFRPNHFKAIGDPSAAAQIEEYREAFTALRKAIGDDRKISVFCEVAALATAYQDIIGLDVGIAPCPNLAGAGKALRRRRKPTWKIVTLGHANEAKGYHLLPDAIERVLHEDGRANFFVHGTLQNSDGTDGAAVFAALSGMGSSVVASNEVLTPSEYLSHLLEADIVLLPYDNSIYETRGSGLFNEAREMGIPVVATRGCAFAQPAFDEGWGIEIVERSGRGIAQAILTALKGLRDLSAHAEEAAEKYRADDIGTILPKVVSDMNAHERSVRAAATKRRRRTTRQALSGVFFSSVSLQDGASIQDEASANGTSSASEQPEDGPAAIGLMMGKPINTTAVPYCYSVVLSTDIRRTWNWPCGTRLSADISVDVVAGKLGVAWLDENFRIVSDTERYAPAMPGPQRIIVPALADRACFLMFRNFSPDASPVSFRILELRATLQDDNMPQGFARRIPRAIGAAWTRTKAAKALPAEFFASVHVQEGATVRDQMRGDASAASCQAVDGQYAVASMIGKIIDTTTTPYRYSMVFDTDASITSSLSLGDRIAAEITIQVFAGTVSAVWIDGSYSVVEGTERYASAMPGVQRLVVPVSANPLCRLVLRNWASNSIAATFRLLGIRATVYPARGKQPATSELRHQNA
jgi:glycosyltransferase involved in cell wall biosynthesis